MRGSENDSHTVVGSDGKLSRPSSLQLLAMRAGELPNLCEISSGVEVVQAVPDLLHPFHSELLLQQLVAVAQVAKRRVLECQKHLKSKY